MEITLNLSDEQWQKMTFIEQHSSDNILALLEMTINQKYEKLQVADPDPIKGWQESGFIGCGKGDANLSTNYKEILKEFWSEKHDYS